MLGWQARLRWHAEDAGLLHCFRLCLIGYNAPLRGPGFSDHYESEFAAWSADGCFLLFHLGSGLGGAGSENGRSVNK